MERVVGRILFLFTLSSFVFPCTGSISFFKVTDIFLVSWFHRLLVVAYVSIVVCLYILLCLGYFFTSTNEAGSFPMTGYL